jgi:hypothetical protein
MNYLVSRMGIIVALVLAGGALALGGGGCNLGQEGERCIPPSLNSNDECGSGLSCQQPPECPENYCCPNSGTSSNPNCQTGCGQTPAQICTLTMATGPTVDLDACAAAEIQVGDGAPTGDDGSTGDGTSE